MVISIIQDPDCKYLGPKESTTKSSDKGFSTQFERLDDDVIMVVFPDNMLTSEVRARVTNCLEYMEQSHSTAAAALKEVKKPMSTISRYTFRGYSSLSIKFKVSTVQTFAATLSLSIKEENSVKTSIHGVSNQFDVLEKQLHQAVKGVKYESSSQKRRHKSAATNITSS